MLLKSLLWLIIGLCLLPLKGHSQCTRLFDYPIPQRYTQIDSLFGPSEFDSNSIKQILQCREEALLRNDQRTVIFLDLRRYIVLYYAGTPHAELNKLMKNMLEEASELDEPVLLVALYTRSAWQNLEQKNYTATFLDYLHSYELLQKLRLSEHPAKNYQLYTIALLFYQFNDFRKAIEILDKIEQPIADPLHQTLIANLQGMNYLHLEQYDSSRFWFTKALEPKNLPAEYRTAWQGIIDGNIGNTWFLQNEYDKSIPFLVSGIEKTKATNTVDNTAGFETILASIYLKNDLPEKAFSILKEARIHTFASGETNNYAKLYAGLSQFYRKTGDTKQALQFQDSMLHYQQILDNNLNEKIKVQAEYRHESEKARIESERLKAETRNQKNIRNLIIGILFLLMVVVLLYFSRATMRQAFRAKQLDEEKRKVEADLAVAQIQLDDFTRSMKEKNNLIEQFSHELEKQYASTNIQDSGPRYETLEQLRQSAILTDDHWEEFRLRFERVHGGYLHRLREKLPDLSPAETRFMALAKLHLTNKEMSGILGVSPDSIRMMRYRLRRKLNLNEEGGLDELIASI